MAKAQSEIGFSIYTSAGMTSFSKTSATRIKTSAGGNCKELGLSANLTTSQGNKHKFYTGIRFDRMNSYVLDYSSPGATHTVTEISQRANYLRLSYIHEHRLGNSLFIPVKVNGLILIQNSHTGFSYTDLLGDPENYYYFNDQRDPNRRNFCVTVASGIGIKLPANLQFEVNIESGVSPHETFKQYLGINVNLAWNFGAIVLK